jgi:hypothetical protein
MRKLASPIVRLTLALLGITLALIMSAYALRILPDSQAEALAHRKRTVEALTVQLSSPVMLEDADAMGEVLDSLVQRGSGVQTAALRDSSGQLLLQSGDHERQWQQISGGRSTAEFVRVPIYADGTVVVCRRWRRARLFPGAASFAQSAGSVCGHSRPRAHGDGLAR